MFTPAALAVPASVSASVSGPVATHATAASAASSFATLGTTPSAQSVPVPAETSAIRRMPRQPADHIDRMPRERHPLSILLVDDHRESADAMSAMLTQLGNRVHTVYDGEAALRVFEERRPAVVVLDLGMPGLDGYQVAQALRTLPGGRTALIIALTGFGSRQDRRQSVAAGIDHHSVKPVDAIILQRVIEVRLADKRASQERNRLAGDDPAPADEAADEAIIDDEISAWS